jgi:lipid II isoglutaminyl synthase (glutamine-hydrolysing)
MPMPEFITLVISKSLLYASRLLGRGGGAALPGLVAEKLDPRLGRKLSSTLPHGSIVVTGTNGKTTATKMLAAITSATTNERLVTNRSGSNLSRGILSALIENAGLSGKLHATMGLFEVDEATLPAAVDMLHPKLIVVLNLFRDQLDRYGELDRTAQVLGQAIAQSRADLLLNADDPLVASLARYAPKGGVVRYFGVAKAPVAKLATDQASDSDHCPICGRALNFSQNFFGHIGHYRCPEGHFDRPRPDTELTDLEETKVGSRLRVKTKSGPVEAELRLPGLYNAYNALAALAASQMLLVPPDQAAPVLSEVAAAFGRVEQVELDGRHIYLLLIKNPTGFNQIIQTFLLSKREAPVLMAINDNLADGRDVSWLWDVSFEELTARRHNVIASGIRGYDLTLRLKYADIPAQPELDLERALDRLVAATPSGGTAYVLPTYTAMRALREIIGRRVVIAKEWQ